VTPSIKLILASSAVFGLGVVAACSDEIRPAPLTEPVPAARFDTRPANTTCLAPPLPLGRVRLEPTYQGFDHPLAMVDRPDLGFIYVTEMGGRIKAIDRATKAVTTALDLVGKLPPNGVYLTLGLAIHPTKPYAYVVVDPAPDDTALEDLPFRSEIVRFTTNDGGRTFDFDSRKILLRIDRPTAGHTPGTLEFGKDGFLYIGVGDGVRQVERYPTDSLLGSILRIDVDGGDPYAIPADNPYAAGGGLPEIFAGGLRNPWRFSVDRETGDLWGGDVGESRWEEINKLELGKNYGWPTMEGNACYRPAVDCDQTGLTPPVYAYPHSEGASVTGGILYRGKAMPDLVGKYIFGDFAIGRIWMIDPATSHPGGNTKAEFLNPGGPKPMVSAFGQDSDGEAYAVGWDEGILYKLVPGDPDTRPVFPARITETGCVDPTDPTKFAAGLVPYGVNSEFWSDGAEKRRFVAIPDGTTLHVEDDGNTLSLPEGGVLVKEFAVGGKRVETRFLRHNIGGAWSGATYEWNDAQTDAVLLENAKDKLLPNGQTWAFPSAVQCFFCHTKPAKRALGMQTLQLNGDFAYLPGQLTNQLTTLGDIGYLDRKLDPNALPKLSGLTSTASLEDRARSYLHTNCSVCHREGGGTGAPMDFRFGLPLSAIQGCKPSNVSSEWHVITPGDPEHSSIYGMMSKGVMPPLASHKINDVAVAVVKEWITSLKACE
jgi:glucose/arabinose dehydrogenase